MHNVEFKAELRDIALARSICRAKKAAFILELRQTDTYYRVASGRLKKRETGGEPVEYIAYERADVARPRLSHFTILSEQDAFERYGTLPLPVWIVVRKTRELWMIGPTRIHLDTVEGLGAFIEFESLVSGSNTTDEAHARVAELRAAFGPAMGELIDCGYADLLAREQGLTPADPVPPPPGSPTPDASGR